MTSTRQTFQEISFTTRIDPAQASSSRSAESFWEVLSAASRPQPARRVIQQGTRYAANASAGRSSNGPDRKTWRGSDFRFLLLMTEKWQVFQVRSLASKVFKRVDQKYSNREISVRNIFSRKGAKPKPQRRKENPWKRGSALRLCGFAREFFS